MNSGSSRLGPSTLSRNGDIPSGPARLPTKRRTLIWPLTSCSVQPAGRLGIGDDDGTAATEPDGSGVAGAGVGVGVGLGAGPKLQLGAAVAWQAATVAATPAIPTTPAARRNPRRVSAFSSGCSVGSGADVVTGLSTGVGSGWCERLETRTVSGAAPSPA